QRVVARLPGERADAAVGADRAVDEPRVARPEDVGAEAELLGEPGTEALQEDVRAVGQAAERVRSPLVAERERERALAGVRREEHAPLAVPERRPPGTAVVAGVGTLDLADVGAERGQDLGAIRPGDRGRHVEDA